MRPTTNFTLHAVLAAALAAFAATGAAAGGYLKLGTVRGSAAPSTAGGDHMPMEILSYSFGKPEAGRVSKVDSFTVKQGVAEQGTNLGSWSKADGLQASTGSTGAPYYAPGNTKYSNVKMTRGTSDASAGKGASNEMRMEDSAGGTEGKKPTSSRSTLAPGATKPTRSFPNASGLKSEHEMVESPAGKGSVWVRVASPWAACRVGARYPSLELSSSGQRHILQDVTVASCGGTAAGNDRPAEEVAFYYNRIAFNYAASRDGP